VDHATLDIAPVAERLGVQLPHLPPEKQERIEPHMIDQTPVGANVQIINDNSSLDDALVRAAKENGVAGGTTIPMIRFRQGNRWFLQGVLPVSSIIRQFEAKSASKRASIAEAEKTSNRPLLEDHVKGISSYLVGNVTNAYILPGLSVNIHTTRPLRFYTTNTDEVITFGYLFLPQSASYLITDGQHRVAAARDAMDQMTQEIKDRFSEDGIPVMISLESDVRQAHQDFADCSRVRPLPPALLATYDRRNPGNRMFLDLIDQCQIFQDKVESTSKSIAKASPNVFTANQVKSYVKALLLRSWSGSVEQYEQDVRELVATEQLQDAKIAEFVAYTQALTEEIPVWRQIASISHDKRTKIIDIRAGRYVCLEGEGLVILGCIGYELLNYAQEGWREYVRKLGSINWQESDLIWTSSVRQRVEQVDPKTGQAAVTYKKLSAYSAVSAAIENVRKAIGWSKPDPLVGVGSDQHEGIGEEVHAEAAVSQG
jgi:DNA sulfur modification protein DndB